MTDLEEWRPVPGWSYEVSSIGRVRRSISSKSRTNSQPGRILRLVVNERGYYRVNLSRGSERQKHSVHRLVAAAFLGPSPSATHDVAHWDGDKTNNRVENLRWATRVENGQDAIRLERTQRGSKNVNARLTEGDVRRMRAIRAETGASIYALGRMFGVSRDQASNIVHHRQWRWLD